MSPEEESSRQGEQKQKARPSMVHWGSVSGLRGAEMGKRDDSNGPGRGGRFMRLTEELTLCCTFA